MTEDQENNANSSVNENLEDSDSQDIENDHNTTIIEQENISTQRDCVNENQLDSFHDTTQEKELPRLKKGIQIEY